MMRRLYPLAVPALVMLSWALIALALVWLCGCSSRQQLQVIADLRAEATAYQQTVEPAVRAQIADALAADVLAATADMPSLPKPTVSPAQIVADPAPIVARAEKSQEAPPAYEPPGPPPRNLVREELERWGTWAMRAGGVLLALAALGFFLGFWPVTTLIGAIGLIVRPWIDEAVILGAASICGGAALTWLADRTWIIHAVTIGTFVLVAIRYRAAWWPTVRYALGLKAKV
jgi:hypothetical protein